MQTSCSQGSIFFHKKNRGWCRHLKIKRGENNFPHGSHVLHMKMGISSNKQGESYYQLKMNTSQYSIIHLSSKIAEGIKIMRIFLFLTIEKPIPFKIETNMCKSKVYWMNYQQAMNGLINTSHKDVEKMDQNSSK